MSIATAASAPKQSSGLLTPGPPWFRLCWPNNETGLIQNLADISERLTGHGIIIHTDAVQAVGKIPVSFKQLGVQLMSLSSHKIYGPKGCGALVFAKGVTINPLILGGGQENNLRAGTENVAAIVGFGKAAELAQSELAELQRSSTKITKMPGGRLVNNSGISDLCRTRRPSAQYRAIRHSRSRR